MDPNADVEQSGENVLGYEQPNNDYSAMLDDVLSTITDTMYNPPSVSSTSSASSSPTFTHMSQPSIPNLEGVRLKIVEQPALKGLRFRYICEGRSAGSIPGVHSTPENKTFPTIEVEGYEGRVKVVVSCVTKDEPYRPHPHNLVGKEGCEYGVCLTTINGPPMRAVFSNLGIQCVKKKDIKAALEERERKRIDPFKTGFAHKDQPSSIDLNVVRLCFQAFIPIPGVRKPYPIPPVVSDPIHDKKSINDLVICRLCSCAAKVTGGDTIILLCEKVPKDDIKIRFFELRNNEVFWEDFAQFQPTDVHKQAAITFKTPRYINPDVKHSVQVYIQLYRPSDGETSEALQFEFHPDLGMRTFPRIQRKLKHRQDMEIFQQILSIDSETTATKYSVPSLADAGDNDNDNDDTVTSDSSASKPLSSDTLNEHDEARKRQKQSFDDDNDGDDDDDDDNDNDDTDNYNYIERTNGDVEIELPVPQITFPTMDDATQTSTPIEEILGDREIDSRELTTVDKITEWMQSNEFERTDSLIVENGDILSLSGTTETVKGVIVTSLDTISITDDNRMNTDLIEQDIELDDKFCLELLAKRNIADQLQGDYSRDLADDVEHLNCSASAQVSVDIDENFDETATYTSLQIALKNPIEIPNENSLLKAQRQTNTENKKSFRNQENDLVVLKNPPAPRIKLSAAQTPQTPPSPPLPLPPRTPSPIGEQFLPPLPPKRKPSQELWAGVNTDTSPCNSTANSSRNGSISSRPPSQIIIMRTPDQSPTKRSATSTPSPKKKQGFFSRLFSRKKSKPDASASGDESNSKATTPNQSREPSIGNFSMNDNNRASIRSVKSLQPNSMGLEPKCNDKTGKAVGRSASSVSGKRPAQRNADVIHIPLKGDSSETLGKKERSHSSSCTLRYDGGLLDRKTLSALQLADIPISDGNMELIAIADRQSIKNLCEGAYGVVLDAGVDLSEAEHFALYTSLPSQCDDPCDENVFTNQPVLTPEEVAMRLAAANGLH
ncbi:embryonic polarity protein dorsal [Calliphora vicina]|uniref:embryonic polarity protein dorsal n=1 Tax=Calliphora vicina TaxID=7373 RepID=UPI00325B4F28